MAAAATALLALTAGAAVGAEPAGSEVRLSRAQVELDAVSAELALARTLSHGAPRADRRGHTRRQSALLARKRALAKRVRTLAVTAVEATPSELDVWVIFDTAPETDSPSEAPPAPGAGERVADGVSMASDGAVGGGSDDASTIALLDAYLAARTSPLAGLGATFVAEGTTVGIDPRLLVAIAGAETSFGTYAPSQGIRNPFGMGPGLRYASWADAIRAAAQNLAGPIYLGAGRVTIPAIQERWAPSGASNDPTGLNNHWTRNVSARYRELGGDPDAPVFADGAIPLVLGSAGVNPSPPVESPGERLAAAAVRRLDEPARHPDSGGAGISPEELIRLAASETGMSIPDSGPLSTAGTPVAPGDETVGDVLVFERPGTPDPRVGIYLGAGTFVHASPERATVTLASLSEARFGNGLRAVRRLVDDRGATSG